MQIKWPSTALREVHRQPRGTTTSSGLPITLLVERQREVHISRRGTHPDDQSDLLRVISFLLYSRNAWRVRRGTGSLISRPYSLCFFTLRHLYSMWYLSGELSWGLGWEGSFEDACRSLRLKIINDKARKCMWVHAGSTWQFRVVMCSSLCC